MKLHINLILLIFVSFIFMSCGTINISTNDIKAAGEAVVSRDNDQRDKLTIHCRTVMDVVVEIQGSYRLCEGGNVIFVTHRFPSFTSNRSNTARIPVAAYPKDIKKYGDIRAKARTWRVSKASDSDESWVIEVYRGRLRITRS